MDMEDGARRSGGLFSAAAGRLSGIASAIGMNRALSDRGGAEKARRFEYLLRGYDEDAPEYAQALAAVRLCDSAYDISLTKTDVMRQLSREREKLGELDDLAKLDREQLRALRDLLDQYQSALRERNAMRERMFGFEASAASVQGMGGLIGEAGAALPEIQYAEMSRSAMANDLGRIQDEKSSIEREKERLDSAYRLLRAFTAVSVMLFVFAAFYICYLYLFDAADVFMETTVLVLCGAAACALLYVFRRNLRAGLKANVLRHNRAVRLVNKKLAVFAHYTNFLKYEYEKFRVSDFGALKAGMEEYEDYKRAAGRLDAARRALYETGGRIERLLRDAGVSAARSSIKDSIENSVENSIERFAAMAGAGDKAAYYRQTEARCAALERQITELDARHEKSWNALMRLRGESAFMDRFIDTLTQAYFDALSASLAPGRPGDPGAGRPRN